MSEFMDIITSDNLSYKQKLSLPGSGLPENLTEHPIKTTEEFDCLFAAHALGRVRATFSPSSLHLPRLPGICSERFLSFCADKPETLDDLLWGRLLFTTTFFSSPAALSMLVSWTRLSIRSWRA